ncbi:MAG: hypothetical protein QM489_01190 [Candidatus Izemoplasma sp.]
MYIDYILVSLSYIVLGYIWYKLPAHFRWWESFAEIEDHTYGTLYPNLEELSDEEQQELEEPIAFRNRKYKIWLWSSFIWPLTFLRFLYEIFKYACVSTYRKNRNKFYNTIKEE